jgi:S1-C subfamily serine protease/thioredoxin-related protein
MSQAILVCPSCGAAVTSPLPPGDPLAVCPECRRTLSPAEKAESTVSIPVQATPLKTPRRKKSRTFALLTTLGLLALAVLIACGAVVAIDGWPFQAAGGPQTSARPSQPLAQPATAAFDEWLQDLDEAKRRASRENKDILILFDGSDWCGWSQRLADEIVAHSSFRDGAGQRFVLVFLDFPQQPQARAKVQDAARNARLAQLYQVNSYPTVVLTDAGGTPYAFEGFREGGAQAYLATLTALQELRGRRDRLVGAVAQAQGGGKLQAATEAVNFLGQLGVLDFYRPQLADWLKMARQLDPGNAAGQAEFFFENDWLQRVYSPANQADARGRLDLVTELDHWKKSFPFKDSDRAARLHLMAARLLMGAGKHEAGLDYVQKGLAYNPANPRLKRLMANSVSALGLASGTGSVVSSDGLILTNYHVVRGPGRILVRLPGVKTYASAEVVAHDESRDMALLRIKVPSETRLRPLAMAKPRAVTPGEQVVALGYPLGDLYGSDVKLTTGTLSATPSPSNDNLLLLDARINPGNSGGPLCDAFGNVVGMVTAKSFAGGQIESYGMALPAADLHGFLTRHVKEYKAAGAGATKVGWDDVYRQAGPSVLMILKAPGAAGLTPMDSGKGGGEMKSKQPTPKTGTGPRAD